MANSKPGSSSIPSGSRHVAKSSASQLRSTIPPEIQVLSAEELLDSNYDMEIEDLRSSASDYMDDSDDDDDDGNLAFTGRTESVFGIAEPLTDRSKIISQFETQSQQSEDDYLAVRQLALLENESEDISVCSDEERDIMAEIRAEITQKVRDEMKSELEVYQQAKANLNKDEEKDEDDLADVEPKLKEAILKMRKLDKILQKKVKREKEVKRERMLLEKRIEEELKNLQSGTNKKVTADEKRNTEKFLALTLPPSHNTGVSLEEPPASPVFQTQLPDDIEEKQRSGNTESVRLQTETGMKSSISGTNQSGATSISGQSTMTEDSTGRKIKRKKKKDFIRRNIQLASDAGNIVAMTDDEKKRLEDLLNDLDTLPEAPEEDDSVSNNTPNPYQVAVAAGDGFTPTPNQRQRLDTIDMRLQSLLPPEEYLSITSGSVNSSNNRSSVLFTRTTLSPVNFDLDGGNEVGVGELALREAKEKREQQERLQQIEEELNHLTNAVQNEMDSPCLTDDQLNKLLDDCTRTMSRATQETNSIASSRSAKSSSRISLYENAPHLPEPVLQKLLHDARRELAGEERMIDLSINQRDDIQLESFSEEATARDSAQNRPGSTSSLLRLRRSDSPVKSYSPKRQATTDDGQRHFLPEIDPKGRMSTQRPSGGSLNNEQTSVSPQPVYRTLSEIYTVRNSLNNGNVNHEVSDSDSDKTNDSKSSDDDEDPDTTVTPTPHPPNSARRSGSQGHIRTKYI